MGLAPVARTCGTLKQMIIDEALFQNRLRATSHRAGHGGQANLTMQQQQQQQDHVLAATSNDIANSAEDDRATIDNQSVALSSLSSQLGASNSQNQQLQQQLNLLT